MCCWYCHFVVREIARNSVIQPQNLGERWVGLTINPPAGGRHLLLVKLVHS